MVRRIVFAVLFLVGSVAYGATGGPAVAAPDWAPAGQATIHPGVQTVTQGGQCTANFVFFDASDIYIGQAAHCASTSDSTTTNGCDAGVLPEGTQVSIDGATQPGTIAYSSWVAMQAAGESNSNVCLGNDFALIRIDPADHGRVNPSVPFWGGPAGIDGSTSFGESVYSYGNSSLRLGLEPLSPKTGMATGEELGGWNHGVYVVTTGIPGDSGSAFLGSNGGALGVLSTIEFLPLAASNNVSDLELALGYMYAHTNLDDVQLANGTEAFSPVL